jgi:hypothetical protein
MKNICPHKCFESLNHIKGLLIHHGLVSKFVGWNVGYNGTYPKKQIEISSYYVFMVFFQI